MFEAVIRKLRARGVMVLLSGTNPRVAGKLRRTGVIRLLGEERFLPSFGAALDFVHALRGSHASATTTTGDDTADAARRL